MTDPPDPRQPTRAFGEFPVARQAVTYRLTYDLDASAMPPVSTKVSTAWTFRSTPPGHDGGSKLEQTVIRAYNAA
jgi:hypothetical protein